MENFREIWRNSYYLSNKWDGFNQLVKQKIEQIKKLFHEVSISRKLGNNSNH